MKIISYNINGIRAALNKGLDDWLRDYNPDIICFQEVKANFDQINPIIFQELGYEIYWFSAQKKGYSGVATLTKIKPEKVKIGMDIHDYDMEGRVLRTDYKDFSLMNVYVPSGSSGDIRQDFKMKWLEDFYDYIKELKKSIPNLIICGDFNICHKPIDIHNPVSNKNSSGFLPEEREWLSKFIDLGFIDTFRKFCPEPHRYSWWSYRARSREKNLGWRLDYHMADKSLDGKIVNANILDQVMHSDHCPVFLEIK